MQQFRPTLVDIMMQKAEKRLVRLLRRAQASGISDDVISKEIKKELPIRKKIKKFNMIRDFWYPFLLVVYIISIIVATFVTIWMPKKYPDQCLLEWGFDPVKVFRPPEQCSICRDMTKVDRVANISQENFDRHYASKGRPVIVKDGQRDWLAKEVFNFEFFKGLYNNSKLTYSIKKKTDCQFFPYQTDFDSLEDALHMPLNRSLLQNGTEPWYIGWSNCNDNATKILRQYFKRPYFLPDTSENLWLSWIFMGGPGEGANMHIDNVKFPSWQAQLRGRKKWRLAPPPECLYQCDVIETTVEPGEILVLDTNRWYHQTHVLHGDISITVGAEFD